MAGPMANALPPIVDPDPLMACDLMDGRDAFLTLARDKHLEFSSLRRSKWSSMCMLVELHNQSQDRFVYTCNECKHHVETRFHCTVCEVSWGSFVVAWDFVICTFLLWAHFFCCVFSRTGLWPLHHMLQHQDPRAQDGEAWSWFGWWKQQPGRGHHSKPRRLSSSQHPALHPVPGPCMPMSKCKLFPAVLPEDETCCPTH